MEFRKDGPIMKGAYATMNVLGKEMPMEYSGARSELLACRTTAWLGVALTNVSPIYDVSGPDAAKFLNHYCVNRDFGAMEPGSSKHALMCNQRGNMIADGVCMYKGNGVYRTYWLAPVMQYYLERSGMDVTGTYRNDEYFFQIDGPKSLEILEEATQTDLHDIKFAKNKKTTICGTDIVIHRLGMSGCLAYEVHGAPEDGEIAYARIREVLEKHGGKPLGFRHYVITNHTPAGYPNQFQHFTYDLYSTDPDLAAWAKTNCPPQIGIGSAGEDQEAYHVKPYDIGWGYLINYNHDFVGKEALAEYKTQRPKTMVTLEWNADDIAAVYKAQFMGKDAVNYDPIEAYHDTYNAGSLGLVRGSIVLAGEKNIGIATGRCCDFYHHTMISLASIDKEYAQEGTELTLIWGDKGYVPAKIRAKVAPFPYYNEEYRNETFDVEKIPHPHFDK